MVGFLGGAVSRLSMAYSVIAANQIVCFLLPAEISGCWELAPAVMAGLFRSAENKNPTNQAHIWSGANLAGNYPMRDWLLILVPIATALYFTIYPDQFFATLDWLTRLLH